MNDLRLAYYGDDFTGSTDVMEALSINGVPTVLFLQPPTPDEVTERFPLAQAVGIAGVSRSMTPPQMQAELPTIFRALKALNAPINHYKICSTFDSSPMLGSIGYAVDLAAPIFRPQVIPLVVGVPLLKRYVVFGNLFASVQGETFRLDRHPTMSRHPATPMAESDLRRHLSAQTARACDLIDLHALEAATPLLLERLQNLEDDEVPFVIFDTLDETHLATIGDILLHISKTEPLFVVGSSGLEYALALAWHKQGLVKRDAHVSSTSEVRQLLIMSGSASPVNHRQIEEAVKLGATAQRLNTDLLINPATVDAERDRAITDALEALMSGQSLILYTALGPNDPAIRNTLAAMAVLGLLPTQTSALIGRQQGLILNTLIEKTGIRRVCVAGGDTSGHTAFAMGIYALEFTASIAPGAPLCRASSRLPANHELDIAFKGGQNGNEHYFEFVRLGQSQSS